MGLLWFGSAAVEVMVGVRVLGLCCAIAEVAISAADERRVVMQFVMVQECALSVHQQSQTMVMLVTVLHSYVFAGTQWVQ
jgi:hypothetical protein